VYRHRRKFPAIENPQYAIEDRGLLFSELPVIPTTRYFPTPSSSLQVLYHGDDSRYPRRAFGGNGSLGVEIRQHVPICSQVAFAKKEQRLQREQNEALPPARDRSFSVSEENGMTALAEFYAQNYTGYLYGSQIDRLANEETQEVILLTLGHYNKLRVNRLEKYGFKDQKKLGCWGLLFLRENRVDCGFSKILEHLCMDLFAGVCISEPSFGGCPLHFQDNHLLMPTLQNLYKKGKHDFLSLRGLDLSADGDAKCLEKILESNCLRNVHLADLWFALYAGLFEILVSPNSNERPPPDGIFYVVQGLVQGGNLLGSNNDNTTSEIIHIHVDGATTADLQGEEHDGASRPGDEWNTVCHLLHRDYRFRVEVDLKTRRSRVEKATKDFYR
jgi:hypothetical protein